MIRLQIRTFLRFKFAAILRMAAAGPVEYAYKEISVEERDQFIETHTQLVLQHGRSYKITQDEFDNMTEHKLYNTIPENHWFENFAKVLVNGDNTRILYIARLPKKANGSYLRLTPLILPRLDNEYAPVSSEYARRIPPRKGGKNRRTKRRHHKKRQTKRRR